MKSIEKIFDVSTGEQTIIERELSKEEIAEITAFQLAEEKKVALQAEKEAARKAVLAKLGLSDEEAAVLLG